jgi:hypothetical protein
MTDLTAKFEDVPKCKHMNYRKANHESKLGGDKYV